MIETKQKFKENEGKTTQGAAACEQMWILENASGEGLIVRRQ